MAVVVLIRNLIKMVLAISLHIRTYATLHVLHVSIPALTTTTLYFIELLLRFNKRLIDGNLVKKIFYFHENWLSPMSVTGLY